MAVGWPGPAESRLGTGEDAPLQNKAGVSPTLLCGAKCCAGMSQESGCSPSAASHAGVTSS